MDYFSAVQMGKARVKRAVEFLQEVAGPSYPVLFLQEGKSEWTPVNDEILYSQVAGKNSTAAIVLCDGDGNPKAMSDWVPEARAAEFSALLDSRGISRFRGEVRLPT
jgi:hypothetical protein